jgi:hypothetical protein
LCLSVVIKKKFHKKSKIEEIKYTYKKKTKLLIIYWNIYIFLNTGLQQFYQ